jgi:hypothetical protein
MAQVHINPKLQGCRFVARPQLLLQGLEQLCRLHITQIFYVQENLSGLPLKACEICWLIWQLGLHTRVATKDHQSEPEFLQAG